MSLRLLQINLHHSKAACAAILLRLNEGRADLVLVQEPWVVGGKVAGLGTKEYTLMLDPKEGKIRTFILAKRHLSIFLLRNYSKGDNSAVSLELQSVYIGVLSAYLARAVFLRCAVAVIVAMLHTADQFTSDSSIMSTRLQAAGVLPTLMLRSLRSKKQKTRVLRLHYPTRRAGSADKVHA